MLGSSEALADLYESHAPELKKFVGRRIGRNEADDVVQDAYLHIIERGAVADIRSPRAFLFRVVSNLIVDHIRCQHRKFNVFSNGDSSTPALAKFVDEGWERSIGLAVLEASLASQPDQVRNAFMLNVVEGFSCAEIAARLSISKRTVERYVKKCLCALNA